jgi:hypothetical protein
LTDTDKFNGYILKAKSKSLKNKGLAISATPRKPTTDIRQLGNSIEARQIGVLKDAVSKNAEQIKIKGMDAIRFEVVGTLKGLFGQGETYLNTVLEGKDEVMIVIAYAPTDSYQDLKPELLKISENITGLDGKIPEPANNLSAEKVSTTSPIDVPPAAPSSPIPTKQTLDSLAEMLKNGQLTEKDYEVKKSEILNSMENNK